MPIAFSCPKCGVQLNVGEIAAGRSITCPCCKASVVAPASSQAPATAGPVAQHAPSPSPTSTAEPKPSPVPAGTSHLEWLEQMAANAQAENGFQWFPIQVSARVLTWPNQCACCGGPSNLHIEVAYTRVEGVRVIRTDSKAWEVPYCQSCQDHTQAAESAFQAGQLVRGIDTTGQDLNLIGLAVVAGAGLLAAAVPVLVMKESSPTGGLLLGVFLGIATAIGVGRMWKKWRQGRIQDRMVKKAQAEAEFEAAFGSFHSMLQADCCPYGPPAAYDGWHGTLHSFRFFNQGFADEFARSNAGKVR